MKAVRAGQWKLHLGHTKAGKNGKSPAKPALFNLEEDIGEQTNVLRDHPQVAERLRSYAATFQNELDRNSRPAGMVKDPKPLTR